MNRRNQQRSLETISPADAAELDALLALSARASREEGAPLAVRRRLLAEVQLRAAAKRGLHYSFEILVGGTLLATVMIAAVIVLGPHRLLPAGLVQWTTDWLLPVHHPSSASGRPTPDDANPVLPQSSDYVSLPYSDPSIANGTEATVRISVPSSQLIAWGVPSVSGASDEPVPADLVLGDDGLPRAIRIASETPSASDLQ